MLATLSAISESEPFDFDEPQYTVGVVAERVGIPTATLRSWNQRYGVGPREPGPGRQRLYSETDVAIVRRMYELIEQGASPRSAARTAIDSVRPARGDAGALLVAAFDLDVVTAGLLLDRHLRHFGVIDTWDQLVRPAFATIEAQQDRGVDCIDVEHVLSWTVSRALQRRPLAVFDESATSIILACTPRETHTLPLEALRAALGDVGVVAVMLGGDTPRAALLDAVGRARSPVAVMLWSQAAATADTATVAAAAEHAQVLVGGPGWASLPGGVRRLTSLREAVEHFAA